jgi:hypothetical protein
MYAMLTTVAPECHELQGDVNANLVFWKAHPEAPPVELMPGNDAKATTAIGNGQSGQSGSPFIRPSPGSTAPMGCSETMVPFPGALPNETATYDDRYNLVPVASPATLASEGQSERLLDVQLPSHSAAMAGPLAAGS